jgi:hypothetical protein
MRRSGAPANQPESEESPFRPGVGPTIATQAQRTPIFAATSMSPGAKMYETQWASSVPIERPGPAFLVPGSNVINPSALMGMVPAVRTNVQIPQHPLGSLTGNPFIRRAGNPFVSRARGPLPFPAGFVNDEYGNARDPGDASSRWNDMDEAEQRQWLATHNPQTGMRSNTNATSTDAAPAVAPSWYLASGNRQADWEALGPTGRAARQAEHDEATRTAAVAGIVASALEFTGGAFKQSLDAYTSYNRNENALRLDLAREETQRQKNAADAAALTNPQARERAAQLQTALDNISRMQLDNTRLAQGQLGQQQRLSEGLMIALAVGAVVAVGAIVFVATRPRSNPSRRRRSR